MNRFAELLKGRIIGNTVVLNGKFDQVRAERTCERLGCTYRYITRSEWQRNSSGWSRFTEVTATVFDFGAAV